MKESPFRLPLINYSKRILVVLIPLSLWQVALAESHGAHYLEQIVCHLLYTANKK